MYHFDPGVCSLRFDFETFTTAGPTTTVDANGCPDTLVITAVSIYSRVLRPSKILLETFLPKNRNWI